VSKNPSLSDRAKETLRRLAGQNRLQHSEELLGAPPDEGLICLSCSHVNPSTATYCSQCGQNLEVPVGGNVDGYLQAVDLLRSGELSEADVNELLERLQQEVAFYTAGTRYSVFGQKSSQAPGQ
jgi:hypothetical protein